MVYLSHRPTYALNGASLRSAYGRIEVWSNHSTLERANGLFKQVIFVIPIFFLGMFAANVEELRVAFALSSEDAAKKTPTKEKDLLTKNLQFGTYGFVQGNNMINAFFNNIANQSMYFLKRKTLQNGIWRRSEISFLVGRIVICHREFEQARNSDKGKEF